MPSQVNVFRAQKVNSNLFQGMMFLVSIPTIQSISLGLKYSPLYREDLDGRGVSSLETPETPLSLASYLHPEVIKVFHPPFILKEKDDGQRVNSPSIPKGSMSKNPNSILILEYYEVNFPSKYPREVDGGGASTLENPMAL
jgi:hypothetical protein